MSKNTKKVQKYHGRAVTWKPVAGQLRYSAEKRTALDGKVWWCIFDHKKNEYIAGHKSAARYLMTDYIERAIRKGELEVEPSDYTDAAIYRKRHFKTGKHKFAVDVIWEVHRSYEVEATSRKDAQKKIQDMVDKGEVCVWTDGFEAGDEPDVRCSGEETSEGEIEYFKGKGEQDMTAQFDDNKGKAYVCVEETPDDMKQVACVKSSAKTAREWVESQRMSHDIEGADWLKTDTPEEYSIWDANAANGWYAYRRDFD